MKIEIEKMTIDDLNSIANNLYTDYDDFWNYNVFKKELENDNSRYIVAKSENQIIGYAGIWIAIDVAHITNIVVKKDLRQNGIASIMLKELLNICKNLDLIEITLEVNENNFAAINLYKKNGFEQVGIRKKYYDNTYNALIMTKVVN